MDYNNQIPNRDYKQNINFLKNVLEFSPDAIILIESGGKIVEINQATFKILNANLNLSLLITYLQI